MKGDDSTSEMKRRDVLRATGAAVGGGLAVGAAGTATAAGRRRGRGKGNGKERGCGQDNEKCGSVQEISTDGDTVVTLVEVLGEKFLFKEAAAYRNADDVSALSEDKTYEATESGHPVEFGKVDSSLSANDFDSGGTVTTQGIDFTPENFIEDYDVDFEQICNGCCGDLAWNSHYALEIHLQGGGAFSTMSVSGIAGVLCWAVAGTSSIPTGGVSGGIAGFGCSAISAGVDELIDVDMIPNKAEMSVAYWDQDETDYFGLNTSPTIAMGLAGDWSADYDDMGKIGELDYNGHLGY